MSVAAKQIEHGWTVGAFKAFWGRPDPAHLPGVLDILTDDITGYWPRPIGVVREPKPYLAVIASILEVAPTFSLSVPEYASSGEFHFVRWVATEGLEGRQQFTGCDRLRLRNGLVCENYVFCDDPFFARVAAHLKEVAARI